MCTAVHGGCLHLLTSLLTAAHVHPHSRDIALFPNLLDKYQSPHDLQCSSADLLRLRHAPSPWFQETAVLWCSSSFCWLLLLFFWLAHLLTPILQRLGHLRGCPWSWGLTSPWVTLLACGFQAHPVLIHCLDLDIKSNAPWYLRTPKMQNGGGAPLLPNNPSPEPLSSFISLPPPRTSELHPCVHVCRGHFPAVCFQACPCPSWRAFPRAETWSVLLSPPPAPPLGSRPNSCLGCVHFPPSSDFLREGTLKRLYPSPMPSRQGALCPSPSTGPGTS